MKVGIIGVGGLGQFALQMAMIKGCEVYASDVSDEAIKLAEELGCKKAHNAQAYTTFFQIGFVVLNTILLIVNLSK